MLQGVANRDIKLENTLLDGTTRPLIKICDFGYSKASSMKREIDLSLQGWEFWFTTLLIKGHAQRQSCQQQMHLISILI